MLIETILVVCTGNICRSPTAEYLLKQAWPQKQIHSAGIGTTRSRLVGKPADAVATKVAQAHGLDLQAHQAKQLTAAMCQQADLILVMEPGHVDAVCDMAPAVRGKIMVISSFIDASSIPDPYCLSEEVYQHAYQLLQQAVASFIQRIK